MTDYADLNAASHISGAEVLPSDNEAENDGWETASEEEEEDDEDGEWVDVQHSSDEDVEVSYSKQSSFCAKL